MMKACRVVSVLAAVVLGVAAGAAAENLECLIYPEATVALSPAVEGVLDNVFVDRPASRWPPWKPASNGPPSWPRRPGPRSSRPSRSGVTKVEFGDRRYVRTLDLFKQELVPLKEMDEAETAKVLAEFELLDA